MEKLSVKEVLKFNTSTFKKLNSINIQLYRMKGVECVECKKKGKYFLLNEGNYYLYTEENILMTRDHIIPVSKGGPSVFENYQPMCSICNQKKGNIISTEKSIKKQKRELGIKIKKKSKSLRNKDRQEKAIYQLSNINKIKILTEKRKLKILRFIDFVNNIYIIPKEYINIVKNFNFDNFNQLKELNSYFIEQIKKGNFKSILK